MEYYERGCEGAFVILRALIKYLVSEKHEIKGCVLIVSLTTESEKTNAEQIPVQKGLIKVVYSRKSLCSPYFVYY